LRNPADLLTERLSPAFAAVAGEPTDPVVRRSQRADFQADGALALARRLARNPRELASEVIDRAQLDDVASTVEVAGPGFINLTVDDGVLAAMVAAMSEDDRLGCPTAERPETVVVDYSGPNVAKEMHVGHLRSTVIGDAAVRVLGWRGDRVVRVNHLGDWGTPFGMLIEHLVDIGVSEGAHELSVGDLNGFYQAARTKFDADDEFKERARRRVVALQSGDETTRSLWDLLVEQSERYFVAVYDRLDVELTSDDFVGESFYNDRLEDVLAELDRKSLLRESDGAQCVFPDGFANRNGDPLPLIVRKSDGGFGYAATDLAAIRYRARELEATRMAYVIGLPQRQHLEMVFQTAREAGWIGESDRVDHIRFGSVLGKDNKMLRTRTGGGSLRLSDLIDEAVSRAAAAVAAKNPSLDEDTRSEVAHAVGIGALKYADLSTDRVKDYVFDYDRMLSFDGNTAPYLLYASARINSIFRRAEIARPVVGDVVLGEAVERELALALLAFGAVVQDAADTLEFHRLAHYLYTLATTFTAFYEHCPVLRAEDDVRNSRLVLCDLTGRVLVLGLSLLGITAPERM
jgi:arginyl-tRNA synthetase